MSLISILRPMPRPSPYSYALSMRSKIKNLAFAPLVILPFALMLTGCDVNAAVSDSADRSTAKSAKTSEKAVADGLLPRWAPVGGTDVKLVQRDSGAERIFAMDYGNDLDSAQCTPLKTVGKPTKDELAKAYASDERVKNFAPEEISDTRTLEADWWPQGAELKTTDLCGRFWVHQDAGKLYAFAPDTNTTVSSILDERAAKGKK